MYPASRILSTIQHAITLSVLSTLFGKTRWCLSRPIVVSPLRLKNSMKRKKSIKATQRLSIVSWKNRPKCIKTPSESCPHIPSQPYKWTIRWQTTSKQSEGGRCPWIKSIIIVKSQKIISQTNSKEEKNPYRIVQMSPQRCSGTT